MHRRQERQRDASARAASRASPSSTSVKLSFLSSRGSSGIFARGAGMSSNSVMNLGFFIGCALLVPAVDALRASARP